MPQFVLIDHSIQDTTGHHYEYALRVLEAAAKSGYAPILAVNIQFKPDRSVPWPVYPVYKCGFWPRMATTTASRTVSGVLTQTINSLRLIHSRMFFSRWGFLWLIRNQPVGYVRWHPFDSAVSTRLLWLAGATFVPMRLVLRLLMKLVPFRSYFAELSATIWSLCKSTALQILDIVSPMGSLGTWRFARRKRNSFGKDTCRLFRRLKLGSDDVIFIPTIAEPEMLALLSCFRKHKPSWQPSYHLLFRRNLYAGREPEFDQQEQALLPIRNAFLNFHSLLSTQRVFFYTDTEELSSQYNRFKIFPFKTCPIPHTVPAAEHGSPSHPLRITYLGDARAEKGYHHLPAVVQDLWRTEVESGRVSFVFQSNYNVEPGEAEAVVARSQLSAYPPDKVRLLKEACSSEQYRQLLLSADVMILPYQRDLYYARSSGVLIEALAAGIPVVVPAASWLAKQIADPAYLYLASLAEGECAIPPRRHHWIRDEPKMRSQIMHSGEPLRFGGEERKVHTWLTLPRGTRYVLLGFQFDRRHGEFVTCYLDQVDERGNRVRFSKELRGPGYTEQTAWLAVGLHPQAKRIWIGLRNAFSDALITVRGVSLKFLATPPGQESIPTSAVGAMFSGDSPESVTSALREVVQHFDHYRGTAGSFSDTVYQTHNAANVIRTLMRELEGSTGVANNG